MDENEYIEDSTFLAREIMKLFDKYEIPPNTGIYTLIELLAFCSVVLDVEDKKFENILFKASELFKEIKYKIGK
jgi:hypothetical protein